MHLVRSTDLSTLETKFEILQKQYDELSRQLAFTSQYCLTLKPNICGPCKCMDDRRIPDKYYCDCQDIEPKRDCQDHKQSGLHINGLYKIHQMNLKIIQVFCDQTSDGGGWTVIQRRVDGYENFHRGFFFVDSLQSNKHPTST